MRFQERRFLPTTEEVLSRPRPREFALAGLALALALGWSQISRPDCSTDSECEDWCRENPFSCWLAEQQVEPTPAPSATELAWQRMAERAFAQAQSFSDVVVDCANERGFLLGDRMIYCHSRKIQVLQVAQEEK